MTKTSEKEPPYPNLSEKQLARVDALKAARAVLGASSALSSSSVPASQAVYVAKYIESGSSEAES